MKRTTSSFARRAATGFALVAALSFAAGDAFARAGGGKSSGSRGSMSRSAPPATDTAPRTAQPLPGAQTPSPGVRSGSTAGAAQAAQPSRMRSMLTGLGLGFLGAGLFGMLSGQGFFAGMGSLLGILGLLLQIALVFFVVRWAINYFRNRNAATAGGPALDRQRQAMPGMNAPAAGSGMGVGMGAGMGATAASASAQGNQPLQLAERDFNAFERLLTEVQTAYGRGDRSGLHVRATPEMASMFARDLDGLEAQGLENRLTGVKLLQGDLAEAWREPGAEFATVAMRYEIVDAKVEKLSGRVVDGDPSRPVEVTEIWTFVRRPGETSEGWKLSAIQQV